MVLRVPGRDAARIAATAACLYAALDGSPSRGGAAWTRGREGAHAAPLRVLEGLNVRRHRAAALGGLLRERQRLPERRVVHGRDGVLNHERLVHRRVGRVGVVERLVRAVVPPRGDRRGADAVAELCCRAAGRAREVGREAEPAQPLAEEREGPVEVRSVRGAPDEQPVGRVADRGLAALLPAGRVPGLRDRRREVEEITGLYRLRHAARAGARRRPRRSRSARPIGRVGTRACSSRRSGFATVVATTLTGAGAAMCTTRFAATLRRTLRPPHG